MELNQVNIIGKAWYNEFEFPDLSRKLVEITEEEYRALALAGAKQPFLEGARWYGSYEGLKFDTTSGQLEKGQYANLDGQKKIVNALGYHGMVVDGQDIVADKLSPLGLQKIEEHEEKRHFEPTPEWQ